MDFKELHETIPLARGGKAKILRYSPYPNIELAMPGRHAEQTVPKGGDFVVMVDDPAMTYPGQQFKHTDIFQDVAAKRNHEFIDFFMRCYRAVVTKEDPLKFLGTDNLPGMDFTTFLCAAQCLAVAEHRRYAQHENKYGGRYLPFRFSAGIAEGLWNVDDAVNLQRKGRPGVELLEKEHGVPILTKELMNEPRV